MPDIIVFALEIIGTIAFAVSGAFVAIKARLDIFGVMFIGCITAVGGGIVRDLLIGITPPSIFLDPLIAIIAIITSLLVFCIAYFNRKKFDTIREKVEYINTFFDAVGLAAFSVMGTEIAFIHGLSDNTFLSVVLGMLTGVGGGIFRDILTDTTPYIFKKHVYAIASIIGCCLYYILRNMLVDTLISSCVAMAVVILLRLLAAKFRWGLPKIDLPNIEE